MKASLAVAHTFSVEFLTYVHNHGFCSKDLPGLDGAQGVVTKIGLPLFFFWPFGAKLNMLIRMNRLQRLGPQCTSQVCAILVQTESRCTAIAVPCCPCVLVELVKRSKAWVVLHPKRGGADHLNADECSKLFARPL